MSDPTSTEQHLVVDDSLTFSSGCTVNFAGSTISNLRGSALPSITTVTSSSYSITTSDDYVHVDPSPVSAVTLSLPSASSMGNGKEIFIKDKGNNALTYNITINPDGSDTIEDGTYASLTIDNKGGSVIMYSDGSSMWNVKG